jgi:indole-3-glycerol phosphate synthase
MRARNLASEREELFRRASAAPERASLADALRGPTVALICEVKRSSPSKGVISADLHVTSRVRAYRDGGAAGLSVLTEPDSFGGSLQDLREAASAVELPLLRKDFLVSDLQLAEARAEGASAALIIARALPPAVVIELARAAADLGLDALVEVRDEAELDTALESGAPIIGVNTRNLETLEMNPAVAELLIPRIPRDRVAVYESGIASRSDVERAARTGADAVLVGSSLSASDDAESAVQNLAGVPANRSADRV